MHISLTDDPLLQTWEAQKPPHLSPQEHGNCSEETLFRAELESLRQNLEQNANTLVVGKFR
ncbi:MAG: hypothetical protein NHB32_01695 [Fischerella sp. CENA71]|nr:hypothetical protein [Fischerella sp. CENA71]